MSLTFEMLRSDDIPQINEIIEPWMDCNHDQIKKFLSEKQNIAIAAKLDSKVIGLIYGYSLTCFDCENPQFFIYSVDIHEKYQDSGYGSKLVKYAVDWARDNGFSESYVLTDKGNPGACKVYERAGMNHSKTDDTRLYEIVY